MTLSRFKDENRQIETLIEQEYARLCGVSARLVGRTDVAEDIVQNSFVNFWEKRKQRDEIESEKGLLYVMVRNESLNYIRSQKREQARNTTYVKENSDDLLGDDAMFEKVLQEEIGARLDSALEQLPEQTQRVIKMSLMGLGNRDIASTLGISVNSVKTLKYSAIKKLKEIVSN